MLDISRDTVIDTAAMLGSPSWESDRQIKPTSALANLRKHAIKSTALIVIFVGLGISYALTSTPLYTANTEILIDARRSHADEPSATNRSLAELGMDPASIDSQVEVLGSEQIASTALKQLHLDQDLEFAAPTTYPGVILQQLWHALGRTPPAQSAGDIPLPILDGFMRNLDVKRQQQTYLLSISFSARTPDRAATIVNTIANVYVDSQVQTEIEGRVRVVAWLKERLASVRSEIAAAEQAVRSLRVEMGNDLAAPAGTSSGSPLVPPKSSRLHDLERDLDDGRLLYASLVEQVNAAQQRQSMPVSNASILKPARPPERKSSPNTLLTIFLSVLAGFAAALGVATWREMADRTVRVPSQVEAELGLRFLGILPRLDIPRGERQRVLQGDWSLEAEAAQGTASRRSMRQQIRAGFSDPLRAVKLAADARSQHDRPAVVGITSAVAGEGRSTVAANLAGSMAADGRRTLLIDADLRNPKLSRSCAPAHSTGLVEVIGGAGDLEEAIVPDGRTGCDLLPACGVGGRCANLVLGLDDLEKVLGQLARRYDVVVLDLPPLSALAEVSAIAAAVGSLVLVIAWRRTERSVVAAALQASPPVVNRVVGAVLNGVDTRSLVRLAREPRDLLYLDGARRSRFTPA